MTISLHDDKDMDTKREILKEALLKHCREISTEAGLCDTEYAGSTTLTPIKILAPENVHAIQIKLFYTLTGTIKKAPGIIIGNTYPNTTFIIQANDESKLIDFVQPALGWVNSNISADQCQYALKVSKHF